MSIYFSGALKRAQGIGSAINKQAKSINLKGVKKITVKFDPFEENVRSTRDFLFLLSTPRISNSNPNCVVKTDIVCNRQTPEIRFTLIEKAQEKANIKEIHFKTGNLTILELLQLCNKHVTPLAPVEEVATIIATKAEKQKAGAATKKAVKKK